jgi:hypothetical protein
MMRRLLEKVTSKLTPRVIYDRAGKSPYLSRYYLVGRPYMADGSAAIDAFGNPHPDAIFPRGIGIYLHRFHRSDDDIALHSHPWVWARSLILAGGYVEERRIGSRVVRILVKPWSWRRINQDDFHRVDLLENDCWSLFIAGPKASSWSFWDRKTGETVPWREFIARIRGPSWKET